MRHHIAAVALVVGLSILGAGIGGSVAFLASHRASEQATGQSAVRMGQPAHSACGADQTPMGYIAYLKPGQSLSALSADGLSVRALTPVSQIPATVLVGPPEVETVGASAPQIVGPIPTNAQAYGLVYPQASEQALLSCDYQLADRPAAKMYISSAEAVLLSNGMVTQKQLDTDPMFFISDDPLNAQLFIVTVKVLGNPIPPPAGTPQGIMILSTQSYAALEESGSGVVVAVGNAPW